MGPEPKSRMQAGNSFVLVLDPDLTELQWGLNRSPGCRLLCDRLDQAEQYDGFNGA